MRKISIPRRIRFHVHVANRKAMWVEIRVLRAGISISHGLSGFTLGIRVILGVGVSKGYSFITVDR